MKRQYLQLAPSQALEVQAPVPLNQAGRAGRQIPIQSNVWQQEVERGRQRRQENMELFQTLHRMRAAGLKVTEMAKELGLNRRRLDRWLRLDALPERNRMQPAAGYAGSLSRVLATAVGSGLPAWSYSFSRSTGTRLRRLLLQTGGTPLSSRQPRQGFPKPLPQTPLKAETINVPGRRVSPQVAAALLGKIGSELTAKQREIVDQFKQYCPGFAVMRKLVLGFVPFSGRASLRRCTVGWSGR